MELLLIFKDYLLQEKPIPSKATIKNYIADLRKFIRWYETRYQRLFHPLAVSPTVIEEYKNQTSDIRSMRRYISSLRKFFNFLCAIEAISRNPLDLEANQKESENNPWRLKEFKSFLYVSKTSELTIKNYIMDVRQFLTWLKEVVEAEDLLSQSSAPLTSSSEIFKRIDQPTIEEYKNRLLRTRHLAPASINRKLSSLRRYTAWLHEKKILERDIFVYDLRESTLREIKPSPQITIETEVSLESLQELALAEAKNEEESQAETKEYSAFPPFRLAQKSTNIINASIEILVILPIIRILAWGKYTFWRLRGGRVFSPINEILDSGSQAQAVFTSNKSSSSAKSSLISTLIGLAQAPKTPYVGNIPKSMYAPLKISTKNFSLLKKILYKLRYTRPNWYQKYHSYVMVHYFHFAIFMIFTVSTGIGIYQSFFEGPRSQKPVLAALPNVQPRTLSFQARLTDEADAPLTAATNLRFAIYNSQSASGSALLWEEVQNITPDQDGVFSAILGKTNKISQNILTNNYDLYMGVAVDSDDELLPRQQLPTVANAASAETLQGLVPITQANAGTKNVILALDSAGNLVIDGSGSHKFETIGGNFTLSGRVLNLTTTSGSNGDIRISPDGQGIIDLQKPLQNTTNNNKIASALGAVEVDDLFAVLSISNHQSAFTVNQNGVGPIISASSGGIAKFTVDSAGSGTFADKLTINGNSLRTSATIFNLLNSSALNINFAGATTVLSIASTSGNTTINNNLKVIGELNANGGASIPNGKTLTVSGAINSNLVPSSTGAYDIGAYANYWKEAFLTNLFMAPNATNSGFWQRNNNALASTSTSDDILIGGNTSNVAKFQISGLTGNATTSGTLTFNTAGNIQTTNNQTLTFGGNSTGNLVFAPAGTTTTTITAAGTLGIGTSSPLATLDLRGNLTTTAAASISANSNFSALVVDNRGSGDILTASSSGQTRFAIQRNGSAQIWINGFAAGGSSAQRICADTTTDGFTGLVTLGDCNGGGTDYAEQYGTSDPSIEAGDVISVDSTRNAEELVKNGIKTSKAWITKTTKAYQTSALGIISTEPNDILGKDVFSPEENSRPVALTGRVPVKIASSSAPINQGDMITASSEIGKAMKATQAGHVIGQALEDWTLASGKNMIFVFVNTSWHDPDADLTNNGDLSINFIGGDPISGAQRFETRDADGNLINRLMAGAKAIIGNIQAGAITAKDITTDSISVTTANVSIGGQTLEEYISNIVNQTLNSQLLTPNPSSIVSPVGNIDTIRTNIISPLASDSDISLKFDGSKLSVLNSKSSSSSAVATIDNQGNASLSGTLRAKKIIADEIEGLNIKISTLPATYITNVTNIYNSTPSATPTPLLEDSTASPSSAYSIQTTNQNLSNNSASISGQLSNLVSDLGTFKQGVIALGPTSLTDASVSNQLSIGSSMTIADNSINSFGGDLHIQPFQQGNILFMGNAVIINTDGNLSVNGNAIFAKDVTVKGKLAAHIIIPVPDEDLIFQLLDSDKKNSKFEIHNSSGSGILSVNHLGDLIASGSGRFAALATDALKIVRGAQADTSLTETIASGSAGISVITANENERTIYSPYVSKDSLVYVTATSNTHGQNLYIARQTEKDSTHNKDGSFTVQISESMTRDIKFNWWIVN